MNIHIYVHMHVNIFSNLNLIVIFYILLDLYEQNSWNNFKQIFNIDFI